MDFPPIVLSELSLPRGGRVHVVREDLLPGGTKQRAVAPFLAELDASEFVYATPFCGFAQLALAIAGGPQVTLFCEPAVGGGLHALSLQAQAYGARVRECGSFAEAIEGSRHYAEGAAGAFLVPLGFNHKLFIDLYSRALRAELERLRTELGSWPAEFWVAAGSGTLARIFRKLLPASVRLNCVDVRVLPPQDDRIAGLHAMENTCVYQADGAFCEEAERAAPVPSNLYYDAKVWQFIEARASADAVWWNVAR